MARGVSKPIEERIAEIDAKIAKQNKVLAELKVQRKELEAQKQAVLLSKVEAAAAEKGISVEELLDAIVK